MNEHWTRDRRQVQVGRKAVVGLAASYWPTKKAVESRSEGLPSAKVRFP